MTTEELNALIAQAEGGDVAAMNQVAHVYSDNADFKDSEKAFLWYKKSAELGNVNSMANLGGWCYMCGNGTEKNIPFADEWLKKSVENGFVWTWAFNELANIFANDAQYKDLNKAFYWYSKSAEGGDECGMANLGGWCYLWGNGVEKNLSLAIEWLEKSAEKGYFGSMERLVYDIYTKDNEGKNYERAYYWFEKIKDSDPFEIYNRRIEWDWLEKAASDGYIEATYILGDHYQFKDNEKAFEWYKKGAETGNVECMRGLGECFEHGRGVEENKKLAIMWYEKAAKQGNTFSMVALGRLFYYDDCVKSFQWYQKAAEAGDALGMDSMAKSYFEGAGVEKNIDLAIEWYGKAIKNGDTRGKLLFNDLGMEFQFGNNGREVNLSYAYQFYKLAAECENADGMANAGYCISNGVGVEKDLNKAYEYFKQAAELGHYVGMANLGWCYLYGNGIEKDVEKAIHWFTRAAEEGNNIWSMNRLTEIYGELDGYINYSQALKWFRILVQKDNDPQSGVYHNTEYNKGLCAKVLGLVDYAECVAALAETDSILTMADFLTDESHPNYPRAIELYEGVMTQSGRNIGKEHGDFYFKAKKQVLIEKDAIESLPSELCTVAEQCKQYGAAFDYDMSSVVVDIYDEAGKLGSAEAIFQLGQLKEDTLHLDAPSNQEALNYYRRAAALGHQGAANMYAILNSQITSYIQTRQADDFRNQMAEMQRQLAESKRQAEEAKHQAEETQRKTEAELKRQLAESKRQAEESKRQAEEAQRKAAEEKQRASANRNPEINVVIVYDYATHYEYHSDLISHNRKQWTSMRESEYIALKGNYDALCAHIKGKYLDSNTSILNARIERDD